MTKYRVRVCREDEAGQSLEVYSQVVEFDPIKEICDVLNKPRRKVRKDAGAGKYSVEQGLGSSRDRYKRLR